jgi:hypothetical protein
MRVPNSRIGTFAFFLILTMIGAAMTWALPLNQRGALLAGLYLIVAYSGAYGVVLGLATTNAGGASRRVAVASLVLLTGAAGGIASPFYFSANEYPRYPSGFRTVMILMVIGVVAAGLYS